MPDTDIFGGVDMDRIVAGAMPQPLVNVPKVKEDLTNIADEESKAKAPVLDRMIGQGRMDQVEVHRKYEGIEPFDVKPWDAKKAKDEYSTPPLEQFGSWGVLAATLASAFTRQPMINSLNAAGSAMQAIQARDDVNYERAYTAWKDNTTLAVKRHEMQREAYNDAIKLMSTDRAAGTAELEALAAKFGDKRTSALLQGGYIKELIDYQKSMSDAYRGIVQIMPKMEEMDARQRVVAEMRKNGASEKEIYNEVHAPDSSPRTTVDGQRRQMIFRSIVDEWKKANNVEDDKDVPSDVMSRAQLRAHAKGGSVINPDQAGLAAERIIAGDPKATTGFARSPEAMAEIQTQLVNKLGSQRAGAEAIRIGNLRYAADLAGSRELGKRDAFLTLAENEAKSLLPRVREASNKVDRTDFPNINSLILAAQRGTGGEDVIKLGIAIQSLIPVYARVLKPTGMLTEGDFKRAEHIIDERWSKGQINAALDQMVLEMDAAKKGLQMTREEFPRPSTPSPAPPSAPKSILPAIQDRVQGQEYNIGGKSVIWGGDGMWYTPKEWRTKNR